MYVLRLISYLLISILINGSLAYSACESANSPADQSFVIASDISISMDQDEINLQSQAYVNAFNDPQVLNKLLGCGCTEVSILFFGFSDHMMIGNHKLVDENSIREIQDLYAYYINNGLPHIALGDRGGTHISNIMQVSVDHLLQRDNTAQTKAVLISGDGADNSVYRFNFDHFREIREEASYYGININGVTINNVSGEPDFLPETNSSSNSFLLPSTPQTPVSESFTDPVTRFYEAHVITEYGNINEAFSFEDFEPALINALEAMACRPMS